MKPIFLALLLVFSGLPAFAEDAPAPIAEPDQNVGHYSVGEESDAITDFNADSSQQYAIPDANTEIEHNIPDEPAPASSELPVEEGEKSRWVARKTASVQVLDKTKARNVVIRTEVGVDAKSGSLGFVVKKCYSSSDNYALDNAGLLEVFEVDQVKNKRKIFNGWMFSSAPGLTSIEHPIYDVMLVNCSD